MRSFLLVCSYLSFSCLFHASAHIFGQSGRHENPSQRSVTVQNESGRKVDIFWVNNLKPRVPETFVSQSEEDDGYSYGADAGIISYVGHTFEIRELPGKISGRCVEETCWKGRFVVNNEEDQKVVLGKGFVIKHTDSQKNAEEDAQKLLKECQEMSESNKEELATAMDRIDFLADCMQEKTHKEIGIKEEEVQFQSQLRANLAEQLIPFACGDVNFTETEEGMNTTWSYEGKKHTVRVHHRRRTSDIVAIHDFISDAECQAMSKAEKDGTIKEVSAPLLHDLATKLYSYTSRLLEWKDLDFEKVVTSTTRATTLFYAHKDSRSLSLPEKQCTATDVEDGELSSCKMPGDVPVPVETSNFHIEQDARVATAFLYCDKPLNDQLGGLHFPYAGVHVQPRPGMLVLAAHRHQGAGEYDGFVQDYHFCPNHQLYTHNFYE